MNGSTGTRKEHAGVDTGNEKTRELRVDFCGPEDTGGWMKLVRRVSWNFPGLETEKDLEEYEQTVLRFIGKRQALCAKLSGEIAGVLLFSRNRNMICFLAVSPDHRRKGIASKLLQSALGELDGSRDITVSTFREGDEKGVAPRALYKKFGFSEGELTVEYDYPNQVFVLRGRNNVTLYDRLAAVKDDNYREFQAKLVPNIPRETIIGVRTPELRSIAKEVFQSDDRDAFLSSLPHKYYEENLIHFFILSMMKDFGACVGAVEEFLPYVDCWPVSDQATPKSFKKNHQKLLPYVRKWIASEHVYTARFGLRMLMNEFLDADFKEEYLELAASVRGEDYYIKMMVAWYFATALAKRYDETVKYFEERRLDEWVHRKAIQKAVESYRVTDEHKEYLKSLR